MQVIHSCGVRADQGKGLASRGLQRERSICGLSEALAEFLLLRVITSQDISCGVKSAEEESEPVRLAGCGLRVSNFLIR